MLHKKCDLAFVQQPIFLSWLTPAPENKLMGLDFKQFSTSFNVFSNQPSLFKSIDKL